MPAPPQRAAGGRGGGRAHRPRSRCWSSTWGPSSPRGTAPSSSPSSRATSPACASTWRPPVCEPPTWTAPPPTGRRSSTPSGPVRPTSSSSPSRPAASGSRSLRPTTSSCWTRGGTRRPRSRPSTAPTGSARTSRSWSTGSSRPTPSRRRSWPSRRRRPSSSPGSSRGPARPRPAARVLRAPVRVAPVRRARADSVRRP